jgi:hypothetical protein
MKRPGWAGPLRAGNEPAESYGRGGRCIWQLVGCAAT